MAYAGLYAVCAPLTSSTMGSGDVHPLRAWREEQEPRLTLDAAAAAVGTVRQVWRDWEIGRRIPSPRFMTEIWRFTAGVVRPDHFYYLPPIGQLELPIEVAEPNLFDAAAEVDEQCQLQRAA